MGFETGALLGALLGAFMGALFTGALVGGLEAILLAPGGFGDFAAARAAAGDLTGPLGGCFASGFACLVDIFVVRLS